MSDSSLDRLLRPRRVAIVGASSGPHPAFNAFENLGRLGFEGAIDLVNPRYEEVLGQRCYSSVTDLPETPDAVLIAVGARHVPGVVEACGERGVAGVTIVAAGFGESGPGGVALEAEVVATAERYGMAVSGPNGLGWVSFSDGVGLYSGSLPREFGPGNLAVISQSGSALIAMLHCGREVPFGFVVSSGNEAVVDAADYLAWLAERPEIEVVLFFMETIRRGEAFLAAAERARSAGKVLVALKTGRSEAGRAAALAHTGAVAGSSLAYDAVFRRLGVHRAASIDELIEMGLLFAKLRARPKADGLGLITVSGGLLALYADLAEPLGLRFPPLQAETAAALTETFSAIVPSNPLDAAGSVYAPERYTRYVEIVAGDPGIGLVAIAQEAPPGMGATQARRYGRVLEGICRGAEGAAAPVVLFTTAHSGIEPSLWAELRQKPLPILFGTAEALRAIAAYFDEHRAADGGPRAPDERPAVERAAVDAILARAEGRALTERDGKALLRLYGMGCPEPLLATSAAEAALLAEGVGFPLVMKVESAEVAHKARVGGVRLGVRSAAEAAAAYGEILAAVAAKAPAARLNGVMLEPELAAGLELLVGVWRDPTFGPLVLLGPGGGFAEALGGQVAATVPLGVEAAGRLVAESAVGRALAKAGYTAAAIGRLAELLARLSHLADDLRDQVVELDLNPVRFDGLDGEPLALDALVVVARDEG